MVLPITFLICLVSLAIAGVGIYFRIWRYPYFPLAAFCLVVLIEYAFDWSFIRHVDGELSVDKFSWVKNLDQDTQATVKELTARMIYETIEFLRAVAVVWSFCVSLYIVMQSWSGRTCNQRWGLSVLAIVAVGVYAVFWEGSLGIVHNPWTFHTLYADFTSYVRDNFGRHDFAWPIRNPMVKATHFALIFAAFATGLVMAKPGQTISDLGKQSRFLTHLLYSCAAVSVLHVMAMGLWHLRTASLLTDPVEADLVRRMAATIAAANGVSYICILIVFHLPAVDVVTSQAQQIVPRNQTAKKRKETLEENGLSITWPQFYAQLATVLSPLIAALPLTKLLAFIIG